MSKQTPRKRAKQTTINEAMGIATRPKRPRLDIDEETDSENIKPNTQHPTIKFPAASWHQIDGPQLPNKNEMAVKLAEEMRRELAYQALQGNLNPDTEQTISTRTFLEISVSNDSTMSEEGKEPPQATISKEPFSFLAQDKEPICSSTQLIQTKDIEEEQSITRSEADYVCTNTNSPDQSSQTTSHTKRLTQKILMDSTNISIMPLGQTGSNTSTGSTPSLGENPTMNKIKTLITAIVEKEVREKIETATKNKNYQPIDLNRNVNKMYHAIENREEALDYMRKTAKHNRTFRSALPFIQDQGLHRMLFQEGLLSQNDMYAMEPEYDQNYDSNSFPIEEPRGIRITCEVNGDTSKESRTIETRPDEPTCNIPGAQFDVH